MNDRHESGQPICGSNLQIALIFIQIMEEEPKRGPSVVCRPFEKRDQRPASSLFGSDGPQDFLSMRCPRHSPRCAIPVFLAGQAARLTRGTRGTSLLVGEPATKRGAGAQLVALVGLTGWRRCRIARGGRKMVQHQHQPHPALTAPRRTPSGRPQSLLDKHPEPDAGEGQCSMLPAPCLGPVCAQPVGFGPNRGVGSCTGRSGGHPMRAGQRPRSGPELTALIR